MNILVVNMSTMPYKPEMRNYEIRVPGCEVSCVQARQTNESVLRALVELSSIKRSGGLQRIIALVSQKVITLKEAQAEGRTAMEFYADVLKETGCKAEVILVHTETDDGTDRPIHTILDEICRYIQVKDIVYIDSAGGKRTISNVIQLLSKLLRYKNIDNPCTLYSDIQGNPFISDTSAFVSMTDLADAFNEFMTTGKADQLARCIIDEEKYPEYVRLLKEMQEFSDKIRIGDVESLDSTLESLRKSIRECRKSQAQDSIETIMLREFLDVIEKRLVASQERGVDYVKIIQWCLDNTLVQQALTLYVEKIPTVLFENGIIVYDGDIKEQRRNHILSRKKNPALPSTWEQFALYAEVMGTEKATKIINPVVLELQSAIRNNQKPSDSRALEIWRVIQSFESHYPKSELTGEVVEMINDFIKKVSTLTSFKGMKNTLANQPQTLYGLLFPMEESNLDECEDRGHQTFQTKLNSIAFIENKQKLAEGFAAGAPLDKLIAIMYCYVYVKAVRNQINHASDGETLNEDQKKVLAQRGFEMEKEMRTILQNMQYSLDCVRECLPEKKDSASGIVAVKESFSTSLKVGDVVTAFAQTRTKCTIDGYDYDVPLILPRFAKVSEYFQKRILVRVLKISARQQITQVEFVQQRI